MSARPFTALWDKGQSATDSLVQHFTTGKDPELDLLLAPYDVLGSMAHAHMLAAVGLLTQAENEALQAELRKLLKVVNQPDFRLSEGVEDIHTQVEGLLIEALGETGKKIHTGRSRNDQVLVDLKLFSRQALQGIVQQTVALAESLISLSERYKDFGMPGYTHFQIAMPSSFGLWLGAYAESLAESLLPLQAAYRLVNRNPLGSGAGYGSSFPLDRDLTTRLLGFEGPHVNSINAQLSRGQTEWQVAHALASVAHVVSKLAADVCLYSNQNYGFVRLPDAFTTGSSLMPHKKNPDVFELVRARCNQIKALPNELLLMTTNLPMGYHRDWQQLKENYLPAFARLSEVLEITRRMMEGLEVTPDLLSDPKYRLLYTVDKVNERVLAGLSFREAYKEVGLSVENGTFAYSGELPHTHLGSTGHLGTERIAAYLASNRAAFDFERAEQALEGLVGGKITPQTES